MGNEEQQTVDYRATDPKRDHSQESRQADKTDAELFCGMRDGKDAMFDVFVSRYRIQLVQFMYRMTQDQRLAEDLAQQAFIRMYRCRGTYRGGDDFQTWLYRIAAHVAEEPQKNRTNVSEPSEYLPGGVDIETENRNDAICAKASTPTELRERQLKLVRTWMMSLPVRQRIAVVLHKYQGLDFHQVGGVLKLSEVATKAFLFGAYKILQAALESSVSSPTKSTLEHRI